MKAKDLIAFLHFYGTSLYSFIFVGLFVIVYHRQHYKQFVGCFAPITVQKKDTDLLEHTFNTF
jgi:hypothetical protein